jgi:hypothetical protein
MCFQKTAFDDLITWMVVAAELLECLTPLCSCEFFLDLWGRSLWGPLVRTLWFPVRLHCNVWISPGLWFCGHSEIESKSSRFRCLSPRRLVASNLGRYKASYPLFLQQVILGFQPTVVKIGPPFASVLASYGIRAFVVTVSLAIIHIFTFSISIICYCFVHHPKSTEKTTKKSYILLTILLSCVFVFIKLLITIFTYIVLFIICYLHPY